MQTFQPNILKERTKTIALLYADLERKRTSPNYVI